MNKLLNIVYAYPMLFILLSLLFKMLCLYGVIPLDFGNGIVVLLVKNLDGNKNSCDNY